MEGITSGGAVNLVKLRGSWGRIGDINGLISHGASYAPATEDYYAIFGPDSSREIYGTSYRSLANPNLRWEYTDQWGLGLDLTFLRNRLDITVDYYNKTTNRLIAPMPIPDMMGIPTAPMDNIGTVNNKGWEFSVNFSDRTKSVRGYSVWGMLNTNRVKVTDRGLNKDVLMNNSINVNSTQLLASQVGSPLYSFYLYQTDGIFKSQDEIDNYVNAKGDKLQSKAKPGDVKYVDVDGNGSIGSSDRVLQYNYQPKMTFSFGGTVDFRGFDLSLMFQGVAGNHIYNGLKQLLSSGRYEGGNLSTAVLDSYDFGGNYPALTLIKDDNGNFSRMSDIFLEKGDYLRLKNLTLGYTLPKSAMRAIGLSRSSLRVYFSADNLLTFTKYSGIDPEVGNFGVDRGSYPVSRIFNFGLNINF